MRSESTWRGVVCAAMRKGVAAGACALVVGGLAGTAIAVGESTPPPTPDGTITSQPVQSVPPTAATAQPVPSGTITTSTGPTPSGTITTSAGSPVPGGTITSTPVQSVPTTTPSAVPNSHPKPPLRLRIQWHRLQHHQR